MEDIKSINEKTEGDSGYVAGLNGKKVGIYAASLYKAKLRAIEHFKPSKKNMGLLWVTLAESQSGEVVSQSTVI